MMLNPILRREAQTSLRSWKVYSVITIYAVLIMMISMLFVDASFSSNYSGAQPENMTYLFYILMGMQLGLIFITVPALSACSISGEREKQTFDVLLVTKMSPFSIVLGKLFSSISVVLLLIVATMPVYGIIFNMGGVSIFVIFIMTIFSIIVAFLAGAISIFFSATFKRTGVAMVSAYLSIGVLTVGTFIGYLLYTQVYLNQILDVDNINYNLWIYTFLSVNPLLGFFSLIDLQLGTEIFNEITMLKWNGDNLPIPMVFINGISNICIGFLFLKLAIRKITIK